MVSSSGFELISNEELITEKARERLEKARLLKEQIEHVALDTVGGVQMDTVRSTSGTGDKRLVSEWKREFWCLFWRYHSQERRKSGSIARVWEWNMD